MEMNTRLQVEHPVTEEITGVDLVEWQLRVACGRAAAPARRTSSAINGWAMEARLYAEDPAKGFLPSIGRLEHLVLADSVRIDTGVEQGGEVSPFYDPMIAKLIAHGATRAEAIARLEDGIDNSEVWPVRTNAGFLGLLLQHPDFVSGDVDTGLIGRDGDDLVHPPEAEAEELAEVAALARRQPRRRAVECSAWASAPTPRRAPPPGCAMIAARCLKSNSSEVENGTPAREILAFTGGFARAYTLDRHEGGGHHGAHDGRHPLAHARPHHRG